MCFFSRITPRYDGTPMETPGLFGCLFGFLQQIRPPYDRTRPPVPTGTLTRTSH
jgi:hypothetical protein